MPRILFVQKSQNPAIVQWNNGSELTIFWFFFQEKMKAYSKNPWLVENIDDFNFWCCPECAYKSKDRTGNLMSVWLWWVLDSDLKWIRQKFYQFFINEKFKKILYFLSCILPNYVSHEITKEFWKNDSWIPSEVSKLTSVKYPWMMHFQE